jgi:hypothetical protein
VSAPALAPAVESLSPSPTVGAATRTLRRTTALSLTPERPGSVSVTVRYDTPPNLETLTVEAPEAADVTLDGFERAGPDTYEWTGRANPRIRFTLSANRTTAARYAARGIPDAGSATDAESGTAPEVGARPDRPAVGPGGFAFVDVGPWAIVPVPALRTSWSWTGSEVELVRETRVAGSGAAGDGVAYLGPVTVHERTVAGQRIQVAVPAAAADDLAADPERILDALGAAAADLRIGDRDETVLVVAAPTEVAWGSRGVARGDAAAWVAADAPLRSSDSVWLHEYVHTRQAFRPAPDARWLIEGTASYYAAALSLRAGLVDFGAFRASLERGAAPRLGDDALADPATWTAFTPYLKGALVAGALDRRIRLATENRRTLDDVLERLNERDQSAETAPVDAAGFLEAVTRVAGDEVEEDARRYTRTTATPGTWSLDDHRRAFESAAPRVAYDLGGGVRSPVLVTGPLRTESFDAVPPLAVGETLVLNATVANNGGANGTYRARLRVDGVVVARATGDLAPGESAAVALRHTFAAPGRYDLTLGDVRTQVRVRPVPTPTVAAVRAPERARPGERIPVRAVLTNDADVPARGAVPVLVDGERIASPNATVPAGGRTTVRLNVTVGAPGDHVLRVGGRNASVTVDAPRTTAPGVGAGPLPALLAVGLLALGFALLGDRGRS